MLHAGVRTGYDYSMVVATLITMRTKWDGDEKRKAVSVSLDF